MPALTARCALAAGLLVALSGCREPAEPPAAGPAAAAQEAGANPDRLEDQVVIVAPPGHVERGGVDRRYDWVTSFEKETGCKVEVKTAGSSAAAAALVSQGGADLVIAAGDVSLQLIRGGAVQAVDLDRIPSFANVDERLQRAPWHFVEGQHYGTPWQWQPNVLAYDTRAFPSRPRSWAVVFERQMLGDGRSNEGRVQAYGEPIYLADAALYLKSSRPELGIQDPFELTEPQYAAALELLRRQRPLLQRYWRDVNVQVQDFTGAAVVASGSWPFQVRTLVANAQPVASTIPDEGATGRADTTMLATGARHPNCAYRWMEWTLNARVQGDAAAWLGSVPAVPAACEDNALLGDSGCAAHGLDQFGKIHFWRTPEASCAQGQCVPFSRWAGDYATVMEGR